MVRSRRVGLAVLTIGLLGALQSVCGQYADTLWVPVTFYDFHSNRSNPEFEIAAEGGVRRNMVARFLDRERKPVCGSSPFYNTFVEYWFRPWSDSARGDSTAPVYHPDGTFRAIRSVGHDTFFVNLAIHDSLPFLHVRRGVYQFYRGRDAEEGGFFPLDGRGFGNEGLPHNYSFTMELHWRFTKHPGMRFEFMGDDDMWAFVDGRLAR